MPLYKGWGWPRAMDFDLRLFPRESENMHPDGESRGAGKTGRRVLAAALLLICSKPMVAQDVERHLMPDQGQLSEISAAKSMAGAKGAPINTGAAETPPDAPQPQTSAPSPNPQTSPSSEQAPASGGSGSGVIAVLHPAISRERLAPEDKFQIYFHENFGPQNFILPPFGAGFYMLNPPRRYPRQWEDGGGAFGRWYGEQIATSTSNRTGQLLVEVALHEDPRYVPSGSTNALVRTFHAVAFSFVDKTDSGHNTFAFSNFAGAAAGGFVGMGFLPDGYNDVTHAERRALRGLESDAIRNIVTEFRPEWAPILRKIHIPSILPEWWTPKHPQHP